MAGIVIMVNRVKFAGDLVIYLLVIPNHPAGTVADKL
jgi:hypothetical protein